MKRRRIPLTLAILLPVFLAIVGGEIGLYFSAYAVLNETSITNTVNDDKQDLSSLNELYSEGDYRGLGYGVVPVIDAYEKNKPSAPFTPGSQAENEYRELITNASASQLYEFCEQKMERFVTTFVGVFYEDVNANRMVLVCSSNGRQSAGPDSAAVSTEVETSLYLGAFFDRDDRFTSNTEFYGTNVTDRKAGAMLASALYMTEITHPNQGGGPYRVWIVRETSTKDVFASLPLFTRNFAIVSSIIAVVLMVLTYLLLRVIVLMPASRLSKDGNKYIESLKEGEPKAIFEPSNKRYQNEMTDLNDALYYTQGAIDDYANRIRHAAAYEERIKADLSLAERIQAGMLPTKPLHVGQCAVYGYMRPAREVGGDMYNYFPIDEDRVAFFVSDVSGKGVSAALFMAKTESLLHLMAPELDINRVNALLCQGNEELLFATAFIGVLNHKTGLLRFVNCGHEPVFLRHNGKYVELKEDVNLALGCIDDIDFPIQEIQLSLGDRLFVYTDGVSEAMDKEGNMFGKERILDTLNGAIELSGEDLIVQMQSQVGAFVQGAEQSDDMCMVELGYCREAVLSFPPTMEGLNQVPEFVDQFLANQKAKSRSEINVVLDELCTNVIEYSQANDARLVLQDDGTNIFATVLDNGVAFDPVNTTVEHDPDQPGGLGILMVKSMTDDIHYRRLNEKNVLQFRKKY